MEEHFTFFWNGPFSNWSMHNQDLGFKGSPFTQFVCDGEEFCCVEQYMMACKAELFGDTETRNKIMGSIDPREHKVLGRQVKNFDDKAWGEYARDIVYQGSLLKYTQNFRYKAELIATEGTTLVEASPYDTIWGIGLKESDPRAKNRNEWLGTNWLGEVLTQVRGVLLR